MPRRINELCINCEYCIPQCPVACISVNQDKMKVVIEESICIDCGACQQVCPVSAINEVVFKFKKSKEEIKDEKKL